MTVLTIDLGTSATKVALWDGAALAALARAPLETTHPAPGWAEQDPSSWWGSVVAACSELRERQPDLYARVTAIGCSAARETFTLLDERGTHGPAILWSDQRAREEAVALGDPGTFRARTGVQPTAGCCAAKIAWVRTHDPDAWRAGRWIVAPRDLVVARLTNQVVTDQTLASRTGLYALDGTLVDDPLADRLPPVLPSVTVFDAVGVGADELGVRPDVRVVIGAGDRACEVLGVGASARAPMVSWGTTANVSVPHPGPVAELPSVAQVSRGALGGFLVEAGLSAAGAAVAWLARLTGRSHDDLVTGAAAVPPGANGVFALPWLAGARAPWWQPDAHAAFVGLTEAHGPAELARAVIEGVAFDVARCLDLIAPDAEELALAGGGAADALWRGIVSAVSARPVARRAIDDAASVGARLLVASALGEPLSLEHVSPVVAREEPDTGLAREYASRRETADAVASAVIKTVL